MKYVLGIDQSTQGTKVILINTNGEIVKKTFRLHAQLINKQGWVSHDMEEVFHNVIHCVKEIVSEMHLTSKDISAVGISNQRETTVAWDEKGKPYTTAVVWQCNRAAHITEDRKVYAQTVHEKTGLPLSPFFSAAKMCWLLENELQNIDRDEIHMGTVDSYLVYRLTGGKHFLTDYSNASRTQLFNLKHQKWDEEICDIFGIALKMLPHVVDSNSCFGYTDFEGVLESTVPIFSVLGDSQAALFAQGCNEEGMVKTTYGTGSSIMMNIGDTFIPSRNGIVTSIAWRIDGKLTYVLEGNINYTGAVITWLKDDMQLIASPAETEHLAEMANPKDETIMIPAFTGLSAPYWKENARAVITGMSRTTTRAEIVKAALDSIAYQITDVLAAMEQACKVKIQELRVDGGPTKNNYLMQFQSDVAEVTVKVACWEELSAIGAAYLAGITVGAYNREKIFTYIQYKIYKVSMSKEVRNLKMHRWTDAISRTINGLME